MNFSIPTVQLSAAESSISDDDSLSYSYDERLTLRNREYSDDRSMQRRNPIRRQRNVLDDDQTKDAMKLLEKYVKKRYGNSNVLSQDNPDAEQASTPVGHTQSALLFPRHLTPAERLSMLFHSPYGSAQSPGVLGYEISKKVDRIKVPGETCCEKFLRVSTYLYQQLGIQYFFLAVVILGYACIGGYIFQQLEYENQMIDLEAERKERVEESAMLAENLLNYMKRWNCGQSNEKKCLDLITKAFVERSDKVDYAIRGEGWRWDFWNSVFFAATIFTTIGYGNLACKTTTGRIVTIIYGLIGIPLMLFVLKIFGEMAIRWAQKVRYCIKRTIRRCIRRCRSCGGMKRSDTIESVVTCELDTESEEEDRITTFPVAWALFIVFLFIIISSFIVSFWEKWDFLTAIYFFFVSLSTIGFGDVIPEHPRTACALFILYFVGLALFSMVYAILQERVENKYMWALELIDQEYQENQKCNEEEEELVVKPSPDIRWRQRMTGESAEVLPDRPVSERRVSVVLAAFMKNASVKRDFLARSESILNKQGTQRPSTLFPSNEMLSTSANSSRGSPWPHAAEMNHPHAPTNLSSGGFWAPRHDGTSAPNLSGGNRSPANALSVITEASDEDARHFKKSRLVRKEATRHDSAESLDQVMDELQLEGNDQSVTPKPYREPAGKRSRAEKTPLSPKDEVLEEEEEDEDKGADE